MKIDFIDEKHAADINISNELFPIRGKMTLFAFCPEILYNK